MNDLKVLCWKWKPPDQYRSQFSHVQVNTLYNMVARHYHKPFEVVCITDNPDRIDERVKIIDIKQVEEFGNVSSPHGGVNPACYRRLKMYAKDFDQVIGGKRFVAIDLDVILVDDVTPVWDRPEDFMIWGETLRRTPYNGSMQMMDVGARTKVYEEFDPNSSPMTARKAGFDGSDQAWISYILGPNEKRWTVKDGVNSFRLHVRTVGGNIPKGARVVFFEGHIDPWSQSARTLSPWVLDHYV